MVAHGAGSPTGVQRAAGMKGFPSRSCRLWSSLRMHPHCQIARGVVLSVVLAAILSPVAASASDLEARIGQLLEGVPRGGDAGVAVYDLGVNAWLSRHDADKPLSLASTTKALVGAAALIQLGQGFSFRTQVWSVGPLGPRLGGLGIVGGGDPCLDGHFSDDVPDRFFVDWAQKLRQLGVQAIDGDLIIDNRLFSGPDKPTTYPQDQENLQRWYSAPASAFAWNDNCIEVRVIPTRVGERAEVQVRPVSARITVVNKARTVAGKGDKAIFVTRDADSNSVTVTGSYSQATPWFPLSIHGDPDLLAGDHLKAILQRNGIPVAGQVRIAPLATQGGRLLIEHASPLVPAVSLMLKNSQNFYAEQLLRMLGYERSREGSVAAGTMAAKAILRRVIGTQAEQITLLDGSGLSYGNAASPEVMVDLLVAMHRSPLRDVFYDSLRERNLGKLQGRVKTGTLAIATCLVGYIDPPSGRRRAFAILLNKGTARNLDWAPKLRDSIYRAISDD